MEFYDAYKSKGWNLYVFSYQRLEKHIVFEQKKLGNHLFSAKKAGIQNMILSGHPVMDGCVDSVDWGYMLVALHRVVLSFIGVSDKIVAPPSDSGIL